MIICIFKFTAHTVNDVVYDERNYVEDNSQKNWEIKRMRESSHDPQERTSNIHIQVFKLVLNLNRKCWFCSWWNLPNGFRWAISMCVWVYFWIMWWRQWDPSNRGIELNHFLARHSSDKVTGVSYAMQGAHVEEKSLTHRVIAWVKQRRGWFLALSALLRHSISNDYVV